MSGVLYLLPCGLAESQSLATLPASTLEVARRTTRFLAENAKSARAFLKEIGHPVPLRELEIIEIGHEPAPAAVEAWLAPVMNGHDTAIISEAGCPGIADPGALIVAHAHRRGVKVQPLVGPSSILLALMASGMNGQAFRFVGYLPQDAAALATRLKELEVAVRRGETQVFIETPYRNERLFDALLATCAPATRLAVAIDLTSGAEVTATRSIAEWRTQPRPALSKRPAVFSLSAPPSR